MTYEYEVPVWFTIRATNKAEAEQKIATMLQELEEYDQIAPWWVADAERVAFTTNRTNPEGIVTEL